LTEREAAVAAPVVVEVLSGIRDRDEYLQREQDFRTLPVVTVDGEAAYLAAQIGEALARTGKVGKTVDLLLVGAAITANAELWSLPDEHFRQIQLAIEHVGAHGIKPLRLAFLP
jgi:predicted nucleic acid-binding protein